MPRKDLVWKRLSLGFNRGPRWMWVCQRCGVGIDIRWDCKREVIYCPECGRMWERIGGSLWETFKPDSRIELLMRVW